MKNGSWMSLAPPLWRSRSKPYLAAAALLFVAAGAAGQEIVASPTQRQAIEAQVSFFRLETDALRVAAGFARDPGAEDCILQGSIASTTYICPAPTDSRERVKAALEAGFPQRFPVGTLGTLWMPSVRMPISHSLSACQDVKVAFWN